MAVGAGHVAHAAHLGDHIGQAGQLDAEQPPADAVAIFEQLDTQAVAMGLLQAPGAVGTGDTAADDGDVQGLGLAHRKFPFVVVGKESM